MNPEKNTTMIGSLQIGLGIVDIIANQNQPLKFTEIQEITKITKSNLYKYLNTLIHLNILYKDKNSGAYSLGSKIISYGMAAIGQQDLIAKVTPFLKESSLQTSLTTLFALWTNSGPVVANISNANSGLNIGAQIGTQLPVLSSSGKIFSTFDSPSIIEEWKQAEFQLLTADEKTTFLKEEEAIRLQRISFSKEPLVSHVSSASVPIFNHNKDLLGCITLVGFSEIVPKQVKDEYSQYLLNLSNEISHLFGYKL